MPIRKNFPSLNALLVLESAARLRSFTAAASELGVTQGAVSHQVALLEAELGMKLFVRRHRTVEPTQACAMLASSLGISFSSIADSVEMVRAERYRDVVSLGATLAFTALWLIPRIGEFRERYPSAQIRVVSQDSRFNLHAGGIDAVVRFGVPPFDDGTVVASRADEVFPVCSPAYAGRFGVEEAWYAHEGVALIGQDVSDPSWCTWHDWFERANLHARYSGPTLRFSHYTDALEAARLGQGVALCWKLLSRRFLDDGTLVRLGTETVSAEGRYNLVLPKKRKSSALRDLLVEWLADNLSK